MGLDVGIVNIKYLERPDQPVYEFMWTLAEHDPKNWGEVWEGKRHSGNNETLDAI